jgi:hypothetical protein
MPPPDVPAAQGSLLFGEPAPDASFMVFVCVSEAFGADWAAVADADRLA